MNAGMMDMQQFDTWSRSRPRMILINRDLNPTPAISDLAPELVERLEGARPDFLIVTSEECDRIGIVLSHNQLAQFRRGEPVLLVMGRVDHREPLKRGRRRKEELERSVQNALAVKTYVGVERLCGWLQARDGRRLSVTVPELRNRAMELLAKEAWLDDPNVSGKSDEADRLAFFRTQYDAGGRLVSTWYPWAERPDDLSREARGMVEEPARAMNRTLVEESIQHEVNMIRFMLRCLHQATRLVLTAHEMSAEIRKNDRMTKGQQAVFAGAISDRPTLHEATRAALDGDFNPADLFPGLLSYYDTLELARLIGGRGRGHSIEVGPDLVHELRRQVRIHETYEADQRLQPGQMPFDEQAAALMITRAAYEIAAKDRWPAVLDGAIEADGAVTLTVR